MAAHGGHGDAPRIVLSPENVPDVIDIMVQAFNLAEKYQMPVLVLTDGSLGNRTESIKAPDPSSYEIIDRKRYKPNGDGPYKRYELTESGISAMSHPGDAGGAYIATGLEHFETSAPGYTPELHVSMSDKRFRKLENIEDELPPIEVQGDGEADLGLISWGSTLGTVREAVDMAIAEGLKVKALHPKLVWPVPVKAISAFASGCKKILVPEINKQGQLAEIIRSKTDLNLIQYNVYGGIPITPDELLKKIKEVI
jgi:2-oxoglutarate ferredoxin oxidoreductase subunit alpha